MATTKSGVDGPSSTNGEGQSCGNSPNNGEAVVKIKPPPPSIGDVKYPEGHNRVIFTLCNTPDAMVGKLRKYLMDELPTMALDFVEITTNESVLLDEFLAQRIGMVPLRSHRAAEFKYSKDCGCLDFCQTCGVEFYLRIQASTNIIEVSNQHLAKPLGPVESELSASVKPVELKANGEPSPLGIIKIHNNQLLDIRCLARKGQGKTHAKWTPVSRVTCKKIDDDNMELTIDTNDQYTAPEILNECQKFLTQATQSQKQTAIQSQKQTAIQSQK